MSKPPAFQFYTDDFVGGVDTMTQAEVGAYILLLCHQWSRGSIPVEPERQQNVAKGPVSDHVRSKFKAGADGLLRNERLEVERQKQADFREKQRQKGILSAKARSTTRQPQLNHGSTTVQPNGEPKDQPKSNSPLSAFLSPSKSFNGLRPKAFRGRLTPAQLDIAARFEKSLGTQWENDRLKWLSRCHKDSNKTQRVIEEVEDAIKRGGIITTTNAQYAEQMWKEFKNDKTQQQSP